MLKKLPLFILFILFSINIQAEQSDSLINLLNTAKDTTRVNLLNTLAKEIYTNEPDSAKKYVLEALKLSNKKIGIGV